MVTMSAEIIFARKGKSLGFLNSLSSAACEWFLILLLFMNALLTYLAEKFARYCELVPPCMLCSRVDRVLGKAEPGSYWNLLCKNHREEISSLVSCSVHCNLADSRGMCEGCAMDSFDPLSPCIGYAKPKRSPDSELVAPHAENDDGRNPCYCRKYGSTSEDDSCFSISRPETPVNNAALDKWSLQGFEVLPSVIVQPNLVDSMNVISSSLDAFKECDPRNVEWAESYLGPSSCLRADIVTLNYDLKHDVGVTETSKRNASLPHIPTFPFVSELLSLYDVPSLDNMAPIQQKSINVFETSENENTFATKLTEAAAGGSFDKVCSSYSNDTNLSEPLTLSHSIKNKSISGQSVVQPIFLHDSVKIREDVNSLAPFSVAGASFNNNGQNTHYQHEESRENDECRFQWLPFSSSLVSNCSSYESLDEISFYGTEGETTIDQLKRQVDKYRRCVDILFRELEEERNAAAIAANQAMAMITRLQEQKAAFHMEALQYLRVLEEQAEYVIEELERANDLLAEKEEELQALKTELELGGNSFLDESSEDDLGQETLKVPNHDISHVDYEDEKLYISQSLKNLCQVYCHRSDDMPSGSFPEKGEIEVENPEDLNREALSNKEDEGSDSFVQRVMLESIMSLSQNGMSKAPPAHFKSPDLMWGNGFVGEMNKTLSFSTSILEITSATLES